MLQGFHVEGHPGVLGDEDFIVIFQDDFSLEGPRYNQEVKIRWLFIHREVTDEDGVLGEKGPLWGRSRDIQSCIY